jgi:uncharacterized protein
MTLPTPQEIEALHKKYAPSAAVFQSVFTHCQIICAIAQQLIETRKLDVDRELVTAGCMLHDIGVHVVLDEQGGDREGVHYITHGVRGEEILKNEGFPEVLWRIASHHTGVGLTKHDIESQHLPLPLRDYEAETIEERLVMYADKFHSKSLPSHFNSYESYKKLIGRFGADKIVQFETLAQEFGIPYLAPLVAKYGHELR